MVLYSYNIEQSCLFTRFTVLCQARILTASLLFVDQWDPSRHDEALGGLYEENSNCVVVGDHIRVGL